MIQSINQTINQSINRLKNGWSSSTVSFRSQEFLAKSDHETYDATPCWRLRSINRSCTLARLKEPERCRPIMDVKVTFLTVTNKTSTGPLRCHGKYILVSLEPITVPISYPFLIISSNPWLVYSSTWVARNEGANRRTSPADNIVDPPNALKPTQTFPMSRAAATKASG